jgi:two-component system, NtrC family, sensor kinase
MADLPESGRGRMAGFPGRLMPQRLAPKLIVALTLIVVVVLGISALITLAITRRQLQEQMILSADQISGTIFHGTWQAMLADRRDDAYQMMRNIGRQPGIERIRIMNREGKVMFSTGPDAGTMVDKHTEACYVCHSESQPLVRVDVPSRVRVFHRPRGGRLMGMITPIYNEPACSEAECHAHPSGIQVLGVFDVDMSLERIDHATAMAGLRALAVTLLTILCIGLFIAFFVRRVVERPIHRLIEGTDAVSRMNLDSPIGIESRDEVGELARSFDLMRLRLKGALEELNQFTQELERKVRERTEELQATQQNLVRRDRLASLGQLSAVMAHEINNPIAGVRNLAMLMNRLLTEKGIPPERAAQFRAYLNQVEEETERVGRIVTDLLSFSRQGKPMREPIDLNAVVRNTLALTAPRLEQSRVRSRLEPDDTLPKVPCDKAQIMQVVLNLVMNSAEAMTDGGEIVLRTFRDGSAGAAILEIQDSGAGIPAEHLARVFDPFFTTKPDGQGVGLGLAVVYGIVDAHGGTVELRSQEGAGTTVRVALPLGSGAVAPAPLGAVPEGRPPAERG